jgi:hypothetical protein
LPKSVLPYSQGQLDGEVLLYHYTGRLFRRLTFSKGKRYGIDQIWDVEGRLRVEAYFNADRPIKTAKIWDHKEMLTKEVVYDDNSLCLSVKEWDDNGVLKEDKEQKGDFFDQLTHQAGILANSLEDMVQQVSQIAPEFNSSGGLQDLKQKMEKLQELHKNLLQKTGIDSVAPKEALWKNPTVQNVVQKQLEGITHHMNEDMKKFEDGLKKLLSSMADQIPPPPKKDDDKTQAKKP